MQNEKTDKPKLFRRLNRKIWIPIATLVVLSILTVLFIEYSNQVDAESFWQFMIEKQQVFWFSVAVIAMISLIFGAIANSLLVGSATTFGILFVVMYINGQKVIWRDMPLLPEDAMMLSDTGNMTTMVNMGEIIASIAVAVGVIVVAHVVHHFAKKKLNLPNWRTRESFIPRIVVFVVGLIGLVGLTAPARNLDGNGSYAELSFPQTRIIVWNQKENYRQNGFVLGFIYNLQLRSMDEPEGYSKEKIAEIVEKYKTKADLDKSKTINDDVNIVYIMSESFADPEALKPVFPYDGPDPIPYTRSIMKKYSSGQISSPAFGGGTADVEFEALTSWSMYFVDAVPYTHILSRRPNFPSIVSNMKSKGYDATAMHVFAGSMYKRDSVYESLGFEKFIDDDGVEYNDENTYNDKISDQYAFNEIANALESSSGKQFILMVTMQNHMPYVPAVVDDYGITADIDDETKGKINAYMSLLNKSDEALKDFIARIEKSDKKTVVVFWGDHLPGAYKDFPSEGMPVQYQTPYFIYDNFGLKRRDLGTVSPIYMNSQVLSTVGLKKTVFEYLLDDLKSEVPILNRNILLEDELNKSEVVNDYLLIEYDMLSGDRYSQDFGFFD